MWTNHLARCINYFTRCTNHWALRTNCFAIGTNHFAICTHDLDTCTNYLYLCQNNYARCTNHFDNGTNCPSLCPNRAYKRTDAWSNGTNGKNRRPNRQCEKRCHPDKARGSWNERGKRKARGPRREADRAKRNEHRSLHGDISTGRRDKLWPDTPQPSAGCQRQTGGLQGPGHHRALLPFCSGGHLCLS